MSTTTDMPVISSGPPFDAIEAASSSPCAPDTTEASPGTAGAGPSTYPAGDASLVSPLTDDTILDPGEPDGNRSFLITWVLSLLLGFSGLDRFYTGRYRTGALKLLSLGGLGIWWIIDLVIVLAGGLRYASRPLRGFDQDKEIAWIATGLTIIVAYSMQLDQLISLLVGRLF